MAPGAGAAAGAGAATTARARAGPDRTSANDDLEKPRGEWNTIEIVSLGSVLRVKVNGKPVLDATGMFPNAGRMLLQSNDAEIFFRRLDVHSLKQSGPAEGDRHFGPHAGQGTRSVTKKNVFRCVSLMRDASNLRDVIFRSFHAALLALRTASRRLPSVGENRRPVLSCHAQ